jgi:hypothetical protein
MELFELGLLTARDGDQVRGRELLGEAFKMESMAADSVAADHALEPTRSVLHRSAASIALKIGDIINAKRYTEAGLSGDPPEEIREELAKLREQISVLEAEVKDYRRRPPRGLTPVQQVIREFTSAAPVDIVGLAEALGISVREAKLNAEISGEIFPDLLKGGASGYSIRVNASHAFVRRRFTVAHELAHFLRHRNRIENRLVDDRMYRSRLGNTVEGEAQRLAADLLMPRELIRQFRARGIDSPEELATKFNVSLQAMRIRLGIKE